MLITPTVRLAAPQHASAIAQMSRDYIEHGLGWSWEDARVLRAIREPSTNVAVIADGGYVQAFGIMQYSDDTAHLSLFAVQPSCRRKGLGSALLSWLEQPAHAAGIGRIRLEARADNPGALAFYRRAGYADAGRASGYYGGAIDAVRLMKNLAPAG